MLLIGLRQTDFWRLSSRSLLRDARLYVEPKRFCHGSLSILRMIADLRAIQEIAI